MEPNGISAIVRQKWEEIRKRRQEKIKSKNEKVAEETTDASILPNNNVIEISYLKNKIDKINKNVQQAYRMENFRVKDELFNQNEDSREKEILELEKKIHELEIEIAQADKEENEKSKIEDAQSSPAAQQILESDEKSFNLKPDQENINSKTLADSQFEYQHDPNIPIPETILKEKEQKLISNLDLARLNYFLKEKKARSILNKLKASLKIETDVNNISDVNLALEHYRGCAKELLNFQLEALKNKSLSEEELKQEMARTVKLFNCEEAIKIFNLQTNDRIKLFESKKPRTLNWFSQKFDKFSKWISTKFSDKEREPKTSGEENKDSLTDQPEEKPAYQAEKLINKMCMAIEPLVKEISGTPANWHLIMNMKINEFRARIKNDNIIRKVDATIDKYKSIFGEKAEFLPGETFHDWVLRIAKLEVTEK